MFPEYESVQMSADVVRYHTRRLAQVLELANSQRAVAGETQCTWGFTLHGGTYSQGGEARACWYLTTLGGESMPLMPEMVPRLERVVCWLVGSHPVALEVSPTQAPDIPCTALITTHMVAPDRRYLARLHCDLRQVAYPEATTEGLVFLTTIRPAFLPA